MKRKRSLWLCSKAWALVACAVVATGLPLVYAFSHLPREPWRSGQVGSALPVPLLIRQLPVTLTTTSVLCLPGERIEIAAQLGPAEQAVAARAEAGTLQEIREGAWAYTAPPAPTHTHITFQAGAEKMKTLVNVFVTHPFASVKKGKLNAFHIGTYPETQTKGSYLPPPGFMEVTGDNVNTWLTPHVKVKDLVCKQTGGYPMYMVTQERLLVKLEAALAEVKRSGIKVTRFSFISGYRTPGYNRDIGNVGLSRHQFGDAADVYVDNDGNGYMDDLNRDGATDFKDAEALAAIIEKMDHSPKYKHLAGGLGMYHAKGTRTPFVHMDCRGQMARWVD